MDRVGDLPDVLQRGGQIPLHIGQPVGRGRVAPQQLLAHQPGLRAERHDLLLDPVVQDRLDPAALGVLARHHAVPGRRQFGRLVPDLLDALGQLRGQVEVVHAHRGLGGEIRQQPAVLGQQRAVGTRAALDAAQDGAAIFDGTVAAGSPAGVPSVTTRRRPSAASSDTRAQVRSRPRRISPASSRSSPAEPGTRVRLSPKRLRLA